MRQRFEQSLTTAEFLRAYENNNSGSGQTTLAELVWPEIARVDVPAYLARSWVVTLAPVSRPVNRGVIFPTVKPPASGQDEWEPSQITDGVAIIEWAGGRQGAKSFAFVDWVNGQTFSVFGSMVKVRGGVNAFSTDGPDFTDQVFSASIVPGYVRRGAVRTVLYPDLIAAGQETLAVSPFADRCSFSSATLVTAGDVTLGGFDGIGIIWQLLTGQGTTVGNEILMPVGTTHVRITASGLIAVLRPRVRYQLALT